VSTRELLHAALLSNEDKDFLAVDAWRWISADQLEDCDSEYILMLPLNNVMRQQSVSTNYL